MTIYEHHKKYHNVEEIDYCLNLIENEYPEIYPYAMEYINQNNGYYCNMFIMKRDKFDAYCEWLFDILFELEKRLDISNYNTNDARVFGFVSERLLDVWINTNNISYTNQPYIFMEKQNWFIKGINFVKRKVCN